MVAVKPLTWWLQFRGVTSKLAPNTLKLRASAPGGAMTTLIDTTGVRGSYQAAAGDEAVLVALLAMRESGAYDATGSIDFGAGHSLRFSTQSVELTETPDCHLRQGAAIGIVNGGTGHFEHATGRFVSNFTLSDTGEWTDYHMGLVFIGHLVPGHQRVMRSHFADAPGGL
jgi:hypothetical protein